MAQLSETDTKRLVKIVAAESWGTIHHRLGIFERRDLEQELWVKALSTHADHQGHLYTILMNHARDLIRMARRQKRAVDPQSLEVHREPRSMRDLEGDLPSASGTDELADDRWGGIQANDLPMVGPGPFDVHPLFWELGPGERRRPYRPYRPKWKLPKDTRPGEQRIYPGYLLWNMHSILRNEWAQRWAILQVTRRHQPIVLQSSPGVRAQAKPWGPLYYWHNAPFEYRSAMQTPTEPEEPDKPHEDLYIEDHAPGDYQIRPAPKRKWIIFRKRRERDAVKTLSIV